MKGVRFVRGSERAYTLLELLLCIAVIAVLSAVGFATMGRVRAAADRAKTRVIFAQWATACELFRQEYGHYPDLTASAGASGQIDPARFLAALTGRDHQGNALAGAQLAGNRRGLKFLSVPADGLAREANGASRSELLDGFGNSDLAVLVDEDRDGLIVGSELASVALRRGNSVSGYEAAVAPSANDLPLAGVRAALTFYSRGSGSGFVFGP